VGDFNFKGIRGIEVKTCATGFPGCAASASASTDQNGLTTFLAPLMTDATGLQRDTFYVQLHDPAGQFEDLNVFWYPSPVHSPAYEGASMYGIGTASGLGGTHVHVFVRSCGGQTGEGVVFSAPDAPQASAFYASDATGGPSATQTQTSPLGIGGLMDVPAGKLTLVARLASTGQLVAQVPIHTREGVMTLVVLAPGPD
jgi:hypothetical protein